MIEIDGKQYVVVASKKDHVLVVLPVLPSANRYWRNIRGRMVVSVEAQNYKNLVRLACAQLEPLKKGNHVAIAFTFYRERKSGDLDNRIKVVLDSLNGVFYEDDEQIVDIHAKREDDKENPRIVLEMWKVRNKK